MSDVKLKITDRHGVTHEILAPTNMAMNLIFVHAICLHSKREVVMHG